MTAYTMLLTCHTCGQHLQPAATGKPTDDRTQIRAIATCAPCHLEHLITVTLDTRSTNRPKARAMHPLTS